MPWIIKEKYSFNKYIGANKKSVNSSSLAFQYKTKKEATEVSNSLKTETEVLKITKI